MIDSNLGGGLSWDTSCLGTNGTIFVTAAPEPAAVALIGITLAGFALTSRRKGTKEETTERH